MTDPCDLIHDLIYRGFEHLEIRLGRAWELELFLERGRRVPRRDQTCSWGHERFPGTTKTTSRHPKDQPLSVGNIYRGANPRQLIG